MHLFFYGILQGDLAEGPVRDLLAGIGSGVPATARGRLYAVRNEAGAYPAMVAGEGEVRGMLHEAGSVDLAALDVFEGTEYRRAEIEVDGGQVAQAYLWAGSTDGLEPITHGEFALWLRENGLSAYSAES
ncbi:MAG TPA: gamma-glutamylcyclotransferase family protein [Croceibacterium sp.]|nr:gamma-glutamylcyclotransferase family protein [Croceibacterium sp.]